MAIDFPRDLSGDFPNGTWRAVKRDGVRAASFACPKCGFRAGLGSGSNPALLRKLNHKRLL